MLKTEHVEPEDQLTLEKAKKSLTLIDGQYCINVCHGGTRPGQNSKTTIPWSSNDYRTQRSDSRKIRTL